MIVTGIECKSNHMDLAFSEGEEAFRSELRRWLADHPAGPEPDGEDERWAWRLEWQRTLADGGWAGVHWPAEYGGRGASLVESALFWSELAAARAPLPADVVGLMLAGPTLMAWGSDEQKARFLPPMLPGDEYVVPGLQRARRGLRPRGIAHRAPPRRRGLDDRRAEGVDELGAVRALVHPLARTDPDRSATAASRSSSSTWSARRRPSPAAPDRPATRSSPSCFSTRVFVPDEDVVGEVGDGWPSRSRR